MPGMDIFSSDAFSLVSLTSTVLHMPYRPSLLREIALFEEDGVSTNVVWVEEATGQLRLIPAAPWGGVPVENVRETRRAIPLPIPHLPVHDRVMAHEIQGKRAFGSDNEFQSVQTEVNRRLAQMTGDLDATIEYHRVGAIKGIILDADMTTTLLNLFTAFNVTQQTEIDFDLDNASPAVGALLGKTTTVVRTIEDALGADTHMGIAALVGDTFFDQLVIHTEAREAYTDWRAATANRLDGISAQPGDMLRRRFAYRDFEFGGIRFINYRGSIGATKYVEATKAYFFPMGVPGLFITRYGPGNFMETVNTDGLPRYAKQAVDAQYNRWVDLYLQSNPLSICTKPRVLVGGRNT